MKTVSVSELKAHLSRYLREVKRGGEVQILDRGVPIARLAPLAAGSAGPDIELRERLVRSGLLRPGSGAVDEALEGSPIALPVSLLDALAEDREDRF